MEPDESVRFCTECGAAIPNGSDFCYSCGAMAPKAPPVTESQTTAGDTSAGPSGPTPGPGMGTAPNGFVVMATPEAMAVTISKMISIWGAVGTIVGAVAVVCSFFFLDVVRISYGINLDFNQAIIESVCLLASGLLALVSYTFTRKLERFYICVVCCMASAVTSYFGVGGLLGVFTTFIGFYMSFAIFRLKNSFHSRL